MLSKTAENKQVVQFFLVEPPPSLNVMLRMHWRERSRWQKIWDVWVWKEWLKHNRFVFTVPVTVSYIIFFKKSRSRDYDNYVGGTKFITDALKQTFFFRDDSEWLKKIEVSFIETKTVSGTSVVIQEADICGVEQSGAR